MADTLYLANPGDDEEFLLARFVSLLGVTPGPSGTFHVQSAEDLQTAWNLWIENCFSPHLAPAFVDAYHCGIASRVDEIQAIDSLLDASLPEKIRGCSHAASAGFLEGKEEMRGNREWVRFAERVDKGFSPGNLTVVFALQSALYHLPLPSALSAYAWFEFQSREGKGIPREATQKERLIFEAILPEVAVAVAGKCGDSESGPGSLRVI